MNQAMQQYDEAAAAAAAALRQMPADQPERVEMQRLSDELGEDWEDPETGLSDDDDAQDQEDDALDDDDLDDDISDDPDAEEVAEVLAQSLARMDPEIQRGIGWPDFTQSNFSDVRETLRRTASMAFAALGYQIDPAVIEAGVELLLGSRKAGAAPARPSPLIASPLMPSPPRIPLPAPPPVDLRALAGCALGSPVERTCPGVPWRLLPSGPVSLAELRRECLPAELRAIIALLLRVEAAQGAVSDVERASARLLRMSLEDLER
jgi:hypothetical protein